MKTIIYTFGLVMACCLLNSCGNELDGTINSENAEEAEVPPSEVPEMEPTIRILKGPMQCVCTKLPCNCPGYPQVVSSSSTATNSLETNDSGNELGLSLVSSVVSKPVTCMCIKAPCNCPKPPAPAITEVEEVK